MTPENQYPSGTLNLATVEDAIYDWIYGVVQGVVEDASQVIWRNQSRPLPARPCVTMKWISGPSPIGRSANVINNPGQALTGFGIQMVATLSVQTYGNTKVLRKQIAHQMAVDINSSLMRPSVLQALKDGGVAIQGVGHPQNLTALEETEYEERFGFEIEMGLVQNVLDNTGSIETINITKTVDGNPLPTQTVTL
jgi:hypothetical protein